MNLLLQMSCLSLDLMPVLPHERVLYSQFLEEFEGPTGIDPVAMPGEGLGFVP